MLHDASKLFSKLFQTLTSGFHQRNSSYKLFCNNDAHVRYSNDEVNRYGFKKKTNWLKVFLNKYLFWADNYNLVIRVRFSYSVLILLLRYLEILSLLIRYLKLLQGGHFGWILLEDFNMIILFKKRLIPWS